MNVSTQELRHHNSGAEVNRVGVIAKVAAVFAKMSLTRRVFISSMLVLTVFLTGVALMLYSIFTVSLESVVQEKLTLHTYQLISLGDSDSGRMRLPAQLSEPRFNQQQGALIAFVKELTDDNQQVEVWRSVSAADEQFSFPAPSSGQWFFGRAQGVDGRQYYVSSYNTTWSNASGDKTKYIFTVLEDVDYYLKELSFYRLAIAAGLLCFGLVFLLLQAIILRFGLSPVRKITADVEAMNNGEIESLTGQYPKELKPLTANLNRLVNNERRQRKHYRERMADLSHSLKTPLSVLQGIESDTDEDGKVISRSRVLEVLGKQVSRMSKLVNYQLQRAIPSGVPTVVSAIDVAETSNEIVSALDKVYARASIMIELEIDQGLVFYGDENDLMEIIGNLLDNAYKHADNLVRLTGSTVLNDMNQPHLVFAVEDDGGGVPNAKRETILQRGVQLDSSEDGQGFGLSIVSDIVSSYQGELTIGDSPLGGALFKATIPTR